MLGAMVWDTGNVDIVIFLVAVVVPQEPPLVVKVNVIEPDSEALA